MFVVTIKRRATALTSRRVGEDMACIVGVLVSRRQRVGVARVYCYLRCVLFVVVVVRVVVSVCHRALCGLVCGCVSCVCVVRRVVCKKRVLFRIHVCVSVCMNDAQA
jgi:hypothetical protein